MAPVSRADPAAPDIVGTGFARNGVYPPTPAPQFNGSVKFYGSFLDNAAVAGSVHTAWFKPVPHFAIFFAGYPSRDRDQLYVEVDTATAGLVRLPLPRELRPSEAWWLQNFYLPADKHPLRFRIAALATARDSQSWLGFSEPFVIRSVTTFEICKQLLGVALTAAAAIVAFLAPGFILRQRRPRLHFIWLPVPGILLLSLIGLAAWVGPTLLSPRIICRVSLIPLVGYALYQAFRFPLSSYTRPLERQALFVFLLLVAIAAAKTIYSFGPAGELFAGRVSRSFEVGARSDNRMSYHTIQILQSRETPRSSYANGLYAPWSFSHRGPIAGMAAAPIVLFGRLSVPRSMPDQQWSPFDPEGFEAYRLAMIVLACCGLLMVFGLAQMFLPADWAFFTFLIAATSPFSIHELYFTWPKLAEAGFVLLSAWLVFRRRFFLGGFLLGFGYLVHPAALMSLPALAGLVILQKPQNSGRRERLFHLTRLGLGLAVWLLLWWLVNLGHYEQGSFFSYFKMTAHFRPPTVANWLRSRLNSALNTLVPLNLFLFDRWNLEVHSIYNFSPTPVRFFFAYWNTLPFAIGIAFFFVGLLRLLYLAWRHLRDWLIALVVIPFALFVPYWGWGSGGLMREGLHAWFFGLIILATVAWYRFLPKAGRFFLLCNIALALRGVETFCVLLLPTVTTQPALVQQPFVLSDTAALSVMTAGTLCLYLYVFRRAEELRHHIAA